MSNTHMSDIDADDQHNMKHGAYRVAHHDHDFLGHEDLRGARLMLEYQKTESTLKAMNIQSTVVVFGSARVMSPEQVEHALRTAKSPEEKSNAALRQKQLPWYEMTRDFAKIVSQRGGAMAPIAGAPRHNVIATGGGPGLMEAANRGAHDAGAPSIGFNITLDHEQRPNRYSTPELTFLQKFFGIRKMLMTLRMSPAHGWSPGDSGISTGAGGLAVTPGGFGTMDEVFEIANLITCSKMPMTPIVLFDRKFWETTCNFQALVDHGLVSPSALEIFSYADSAEEGWDAMQQRWSAIAADRKT